MKQLFYLLVLVIICSSCGQDYIPKPKAYLRLEYPEATYKKATIDVPFLFETNGLATKVIFKAFS